MQSLTGILPTTSCVQMRRGCGMPRTQFAKMQGVWEMKLTTTLDGLNMTATRSWRIESTILTNGKTHWIDVWLTRMMKWQYCKSRRRRQREPSMQRICLLMLQLNAWCWEKTELALISYVTRLKNNFTRCALSKLCMQMFISTVKQLQWGSQWSCSSCWAGPTIFENKVFQIAKYIFFLLKHKFPILSNAHYSFL